MADLHVHRQHPLGLDRVRGLIDAWIVDGQSRFGLRCELVRAEEGDFVTFSRTGVSGTLRATASHLELTAKLGFLLSPYAKRISEDIHRQLNEALGPLPE